jgi:hypothetical protein
MAKKLTTSVLLPRASLNFAAEWGIFTDISKPKLLGLMKYDRTNGHLRESAQQYSPSPLHPIKFRM